MKRTRQLQNISAISDVGGQTLHAVLAREPAHGASGEHTGQSGIAGPSVIGSATVVFEGCVLGVYSSVASCLGICQTVEYG